ncbi:hypothetical protein [Dactylosporangium sp. NPDC000521]|uniref:hypothetical protein n=1 Tax=Dactylosporangium sp. NPDC000521 TaxID=3363975 RepID=UPI00368CFF7F
MTLAEWIQIIAATAAVAAAVAAASAARSGRGAARTAAKQLPELQIQVEINAAQAKAADEQVVLAQVMLKAATTRVPQMSGSSRPRRLALNWANDGWPGDGACH